MEMVTVRTNEAGEQLVSAQELHKAMEITTKFHVWFQNRVRRYGFKGDEDYVTLVQKKSTAQGNSTKSTDYILKLDMAKELAMVERNSKGKEVRKYFIRIEEEYKRTQHERILEMQDKINLLGTIDLDEVERVSKIMEKITQKEKGYLKTVAGELLDVSARDVNKYLERMGFQEKDGSRWKVTEKGREHQLFETTGAGYIKRMRRTSFKDLQELEKFVTDENKPKLLTLFD